MTGSPDTRMLLYERTNFAQLQEVDLSISLFTGLLTSLKHILTQSIN